MPGQLPKPAGLHPEFFPMTIREQALADFSEQMDRLLADFELRLVKPRKHPRLVLEGDRARASKPK